MTRLRFVTFNIAHGRGLNPIQGTTSRRKIRANLLKIARLLHELNPDVVALQEIDENSRWAGSFDHLEFLREFGGFPHSVFGINTRRQGLLTLSYGNALLSKHPITTSENIAFGTRTVGEKGFLFAEIAVEGRCVPVINLHLHYRSRVQRFKQLDRLLAYVWDKHRLRDGVWSQPPIICGDFNTPDKAGDVTSSLLSHLHDYADYALYPREGNTFPSPLPGRRLDFVFLPPECRVVEAEIVRTFLSDHRPVVVDVELGVAGPVAARPAD